MAKKLICPHCGSKDVEKHSEYFVCNNCKNSFGRVALSDEGTPMVDAVTGLRFRYGDIVSGSVHLRMIQEKDGSCVYEVYDANEGSFDKVADVLSKEDWTRLKDWLFNELYLLDWNKEYIPENNGQNQLDNNEWELGIDINWDEGLEYRGYDAYPPYWKEFLKAVEPLFNKLKK